MVDRKVLMLMMLLMLRKKNSVTNVIPYNNAWRSEKRMKLFRRRQSRQRLLFLILLLSILYKCGRVERRIWIKERSRYFWEYIVKKTFSEDDWYQNFRVSKQTFYYICRKLEHYVAKRDTQLRLAIPVELRIAVTLWCLATSTDYRTLSHLFGLSKSSICLIIREVCRAIVDHLTKLYIKIPTENEMREMMMCFKEKYGFPCCGGALDGSHIPISAPAANHTDFYNRKGWYSIILQGLVDHRYCFIDVYTGWPGSVHDARVFAHSSVYKKGTDGTLYPSWTTSIQEENIPIVILGDSAYPLLKWLMKPLPHNGALTQEQKRFNYHLSTARVVSKNAFGRLKGRWRCLSKRIDMNPETFQF